MLYIIYICYYDQCLHLTFLLFPSLTLKVKVYTEYRLPNSQLPERSADSAGLAGTWKVNGTPGGSIQGSVAPTDRDETQGMQKQGIRLGCYNQAKQKSTQRRLLTFFWPQYQDVPSTLYATITAHGRQESLRVKEAGAINKSAEAQNLVLLDSPHWPWKNHPQRSWMLLTYWLL